MHISAQNRKYVLVWIVLLFLGSANFGAKAQKRDNLTEYTSNTNSYPKNHIYLNLLGDGSIYSLNYDRVWMLGEPNDSRQFLSTKIGIGYNEEFSLYSDVTDSYTTIPHHLTYNIGGPAMHFEVGLGGTLVLDQEPEYIIYPTLGMRFVPKRRQNFNLRLFAQLPVLPYYDFKTRIWFLPFGTSLGVSF